MLEGPPFHFFAVVLIPYPPQRPPWCVVLAYVWSHGDPLSSMLFILAIEPLQRLLDHATEQGVLSSLAPRATRLCTNMYDDDATLFINPIKNEIAAVCDILERFGQIFVLMINAKKCVAYPIRCEALDFDNIIEDFGALVGSLSLPIAYTAFGVLKASLRGHSPNY